MNHEDIEIYIRYLYNNLNKKDKKIFDHYIGSDIDDLSPRHLKSLITSLERLSSEQIQNNRIKSIDKLL